MPSAASSVRARRGGTAARGHAGHQPPVLEPQHAVGDRRRARLVGDEHDRAALVGELAQQREHARRRPRTSRLPVGSSASSSDGSLTSARAIAKRCCSPPESWCGSESGDVRAARAGRPARGRAAGAAGSAPRTRAGEQHVRLAAQLGQQVEELEDEADVAAPQRGQPALAGAGDALAGDLDRRPPRAGRARRARAAASTCPSRSARARRRSRPPRRRGRRRRARAARRGPRPKVRTSPRALTTAIGSTVGRTHARAPGSPTIAGAGNRTHGGSSLGA